jgi:hypothetical protein
MTQLNHHSSLHLGTTTGSGERPAQFLAGEVLRFALHAEVERLHAEPAWQRGDRNAVTLVKEGDLRMTLVSLKAGGCLEPAPDGRL